MGLVSELKTNNLWNKFKKEIKGVKFGFYSIIFSASFIFSLALVHTYKNLEESTSLYMLSISSFIIAFLYKKICFHFIQKKYKKLIKS